MPTPLAFKFKLFGATDIYRFVWLLVFFNIDALYCRMKAHLERKTTFLPCMQMLKCFCNVENGKWSLTITVIQFRDNELIVFALCNMSYWIILYSHIHWSNEYWDENDPLTNNISYFIWNIQNGFDYTNIVRYMQTLELSKQKAKIITSKQQNANGKNSKNKRRDQDKIYELKLSHSASYYWHSTSLTAKYCFCLRRII